MSLVVANASAGPTTITLSAITVSGIVTVKDSGSASATNVVTILAAAGNTFESGLTSYTLNTASAYISFVGNASTLKWRVLGSTYADIPVVSPVPSPPALGGNLSASLSNLSVSGQTSLSTLSLTGQGNIRSLTTNSGFAQISAGQFPLLNARGLCFDPSGNMYVPDTSKYVIYEINPQGLVSLFAGTYGINGVVDGFGSGAGFSEIWQMCYDSYSGWIIIANISCIRAANPATGQVITLCGSSTLGNSPGLGAAASFQAPGGVCSDGAGNIYVADNTNNNICKVSFTLPISAGGGTKSIIAGPTTTPLGASGYYNNATGTSATFNAPRALVINSSKTLLWVLDHVNNVVRQVSLTSPFAVTTYAGDVGSSATPGNTTSPAAGNVNSDTATSVRFNAPHGIAIDASNNLFIIEYLGRRLKYINTNNFFTLTLAGNGTAANVAGVGANSAISGGTAVALDPTGSPWVVAYDAPAIFNYNVLSGYLSIYWSSQGNGFSAYSLQNTAISTISMPGITTANIYGSGFTTFNQPVKYTYPSGAIMDSQNNLYVGDYGKIRKVTPSGFVTSIYGDPSNTQNSYQNGTGALGQQNGANQMCFDNSGNLYFCNFPYSLIYRLNLATQVCINLPLTVNTTLAQAGTCPWLPMGILFNNNTLYVANRGYVGSLSSYICAINLSTNAVTLIAGSPGVAGGNVNNATGSLAKFNGLTGICFDSTKSNILACDYGNNAIRVISLTPPYAVSTLSFTGTLNVPVYIVMDSRYNLYVTQQASPIGVIKIPYTGSYSLPSLTYGTSVTLTSSLFGSGYGVPQGITVDSYNNIYFADSSLKSVMYIKPNSNVNLYSGLYNISGTQDSLYASSITLMAPYVGIGTSNPQAPLQVVGSNVIDPGTFLTATYPDVYFSVLSYCSYFGGDRAMMEIGSTHAGTGNNPCTYKYLMGFSNVAGVGGNFIIQSVNTTNPSYGFNTTATPTTLFTLNNSGLKVNGVLQVGNGGGGVNWIQDFAGRTRVGWGNGAGTDTIIVGDPTASNAGGGVGFYAGQTQKMYINANGLITLASNVNVGGVDLDVAANGNTNNDIRISLHHHDNPAVANERQFLCASATLNDISLGAGCHSSGANWNPYNTAGTPAVGFISCRKGLVKIYTGNMGGATADSGLTGTLTASSGGNWVYSSDERVKENITPLENCLDFVKSVRTVKYSFINANSSVPTQIGFLAQDFQASFPEVVSKSDGEHLGLSYSDTIPIAVAAIKELNTIVETQASTIIALQVALDSQQSTINAILRST